MPLIPRRVVLGVLIVAIASLGARPPPARAFLDNVGRNAGVSAVEKLPPILAAALADAGGRLTRAEDHLGDIGGGLLNKVDHILEARLLQVKVEANDVTDHALAGVDELARNRLAQADVIASKLVTNVGKEAQVALNKASDLLHDRIGDLGREVDGAVEKADQALAARIDQLDEAAGRRLGNVDVIASKQRIALEETAAHVAVLIGLVVFVVFVLRRLWGRYGELTAGEPARVPARKRGHKLGGEETASDGPPTQQWRARGAQRSWMFARELGAPLVGRLALAAAALGVLFVLYDRLPFAARQEAADLARTHEQGLAQSLRLFDFTQVRFHASQLEYLMPDQAARYRGLAAKGDLLRDLFQRPTLLATDPGIAEVWRRLGDTRRLLGRAPDPDLLVVEAMLLWQTGGTRREEQRAASLCARALRIDGRPGGFALAPLARTYVERYLDAPYVDEAAGVGRNAETPANLRAILDAVAPDETNHPLSARLGLVRLMRRIDVLSSATYVATARAHATLVQLVAARAPTGAVQNARAARTAAAKTVVAVWAEFDRALRASSELARNPVVLAIFRLDDVAYSRAKWFVDHPETTQEAPLLAKGVVALPVRMELAPPRVAWVRRYADLIRGPAHDLVELQEAERFAERERAAQDFERALVAATAAPGSSPVSQARAAAAARAAARLGLYVGGQRPGIERVPLARQLLPAGGDRSLDEALSARGVQLL
jgi:hypothetical protein